MIGINPAIIRKAAMRFASRKPEPKQQPKPAAEQDRYKDSLRQRVLRLAENLQSFRVVDIVGATGATKEQAWACICKLAQQGRVEVVKARNTRIPGTGRGGQEAVYRRVQV